MPTPSEAFAAVAAQPGAEIYIAAKLQGADPVTGDVTPLYVTNAPALYTDAGDDPPSTGFRNIVRRGIETSRSISPTSGAARGAILGASEINNGTLEIDDSGGDLSHLLGLDWGGQPLEILVGARLQADGTPYPFSLYRRYFSGVSRDLTRTSSGSLVFGIEGRAADLETSISKTFYRGFGGAVASGSADAMTGPDDAAYDLLGGLSLEFFGVVEALPVAESALVRRGQDYGISIGTGGAVSFLYDGGTLIASSFVITPGDPVFLAFSAEPTVGGWSVKGYAGTTSADISETLDVIVADVPMVGGGWSFGDGMDFEVWEARIWNAARSLDDHLETSDATISAPADRSDLVEAWKFGEGTGSTALGEKGISNLTLSGSQAFASSLEGDNPEQFGGGPIGDFKPRLLGARASNVLAIPVDSQRNDYQWSDRPSANLYRAFIKGAQLVPVESQTSDALGEITTDGADDSINFTPASGLTGIRFYPGQFSPQVLGQRIEISGSASAADGTYRVKVGGISGDGLKILVEADGVDGAVAGLPALSLQSGTSVSTPATDGQFSYDLANSTIRVVDSADGEVTVDAAGDFGERASEIFEALAAELGKSVDLTALTFDPLVALAIKSGSGSTLSYKDAFDALARSCVGWWVETRDGEFKFANWELPSGSVAVATITADRADLLDPSIVAPVIGRIISLEELPSPTPSNQVSIGYAKTWHTQERSGLVGSLSAGRRETLANEYRYVTRNFPKISRRFPNAAPLSPIGTLIVERNDAEQAASRAATLFATDKRRWWSVSVAGLAFLSVDVHDEVVLQHPAPQLGLQDGISCRIVSLEESPSTDIVELVLFS